MIFVYFTHPTNKNDHKIILNGLWITSSLLVNILKANRNWLYTIAAATYTYNKIKWSTVGDFVTAVNYGCNLFTIQALALICVNEELGQFTWMVSLIVQGNSDSANDVDAKWRIPQTRRLDDGVSVTFNAGKLTTLEISVASKFWRYKTFFHFVTDAPGW